jgi:type I restriction enzyme M protein
MEVGSRRSMLAGGDTKALIVTNGCHRIRLKNTQKDRLLDLVAALSTESYSTQMRAFARGSDGLAEVGEDDAADVLIPRIDDTTLRAQLKPFVDQLLAGHTSIRAKIDDMIEHGTLPVPVPAKRPSHSVLV